MSARERVLRFAKENHNNLIDPWCDPETGFFIDDWQAHLSGLLDAYAHELAERLRDQRHEGHDQIKCVPCFIYGEAGDLIDPEVSNGD